MAGIVAIITDTSFGILRLLIGAAGIGVGKIGDRLVLDYLASSLRDIEAQSGRRMDIVIPYADRLQETLPRLAPAELFNLEKMPPRTIRYNRTLEHEQSLKRQLFQMAEERHVQLLPIDRRDGLLQWCQANILLDATVLHVTSGQVALNISLTLKLLEAFSAGEHASLAAQGHGSGLTPVLYQSTHWLEVLANWPHDFAIDLPPPEAPIAIDNDLVALEEKGIRLAYENGRDLPMALLLRRNSDPGRISPPELAELLQQNTEHMPYWSKDGNSYTIYPGERLKYRKRKPPLGFQAQLDAWQKDIDLLKKKAGLDLAGLDVLEVGSGAGIFSMLARRAGARRVVASDFVLNIGHPLQQRFLATIPSADPFKKVVQFDGRTLHVSDPNLVFVECAAEQIPFTAGNFDLVYSDQVLEHVRNPHACLQEMLRVLKPGGVLFFKYNPWFHLAGGHGNCTLDIPWGHVLMSADEIEQYVADTEFPERAVIARTAYDNDFTPERLTLTQFQAILAQLMPFELLHAAAPVSRHRAELIDDAFLARCRTRFPGIEKEDLLTVAVVIILRKLQ